jgi:chromosomal replication initiator protein
MQRELETTWQRVRAELRAGATDIAYHLWLAPLELAHRDDGLLYVKAPRHIRTLVEERYLQALEVAAAQALSRPVSVVVVSDDWSPGHEESVAEDQRRGRGRLPTQAFNPKYCFDQFVITEGNWLAHAAALTVAEQPGQTYNPLFLHGAPGLGKTHLLHAIGSYVQRHSRELTVRYATSDEFTDGFIRAIRSDGTEEFKARFRRADVLLIDDVQFLADRARTQEEFFHTFNVLFESGRQLVLTSDRAPGELTAFERRLTERFACGLVVSVEPPELEARLAILRKRAALDGLTAVEDDVLLELARRSDLSIRALEGALIRLVAHASLTSSPPTPDLARRLVDRVDETPESRWTVGQVQEATATTLKVPLQALMSHDRRPAHTFARQVAMYLARELTDESLPSIGAGFGGRGHSTVLHAHRKIAGEVDAGSTTAKAVDSVRRALNERSPDRS